MKKLLIIFLMPLFAMAAVSCGDNKDNGEDIGEISDVELSESSLVISDDSFGHWIDIIGGSGEYSVTTTVEDIVLVTIVPSIIGETGKDLLIVPMYVGETDITVTDKKTGKTAVCALTVASSARPNPTAFGLNIVDVRYYIDAKSKKREIEDDLRATTPFPVGITHVLKNNDGVSGEWSIEVPDGMDDTEFTGGTFAFDNLGEKPNNYVVLPVDNQIYAYLRLKLSNAANEYTYDVFMVRGEASRVDMMWFHYQLLEELTEHYKAKYPDAGVRAVVRSQICDPDDRYN